MKTTITRTALVITGFLLGLVTSPFAGPDLQISGCIIRFPTATPVILNDTNHHCSPNVTGVSVAGNGDLIISHDAVTQVVNAIVVMDETLSARGIIGGASAGLTQTIIHFYSTDLNTSIRADGLEIRGNNSNIFISWIAVE